VVVVDADLQAPGVEVDRLRDAALAESVAVALNDDPVAHGVLTDAASREAGRGRSRPAGLEVALAVTDVAPDDIPALGAAGVTQLVLVEPPPDAARSTASSSPCWPPAACPSSSPPPSSSRRGTERAPKWPGALPRCIELGKRVVVLAESARLGDRASPDDA
jgi:hypothetical protein